MENSNDNIQIRELSELEIDNVGGGSVYFIMALTMLCFASGIAVGKVAAAS